jgi:hypothetical protein
LRIAVSGSHGVGKSSLIASFLDRHPEYAHEPEAFEVLGDDIDLSESTVPTSDGLRLLLEYTVAVVQDRALEAHVVFERSPVDYLAYAAASGGAWPPGERVGFLESQKPIVRASIQQLQLIAYLPLSTAGAAGRRGEEERFRQEVDICLRRALLEDEYELFGAGRPPRVVELPPGVESQLGLLSRFVQEDDR